MKGKIVILSIIVAILVVLGSLSPVVCSKDLKPISNENSNENITIEVNIYDGKHSEPIYTELPSAEVEEIKQILTQLNEAIENNDEEAVSQYEKQLNEKGIFGDKYQEFFSLDKYTEMMGESNLLEHVRNTNGDDISNYMCYFNAVGKGNMFFTLGIRMIEAIQRAINNASSFLEALILLLALLPFFVLIHLFTLLIPFRILMPIGVVSMHEGKISSLGLMGLKQLEVVDTEPVNVNISWFTGITLNIPATDTTDPFLFASGIAVEVSETDT